MSDWLKMPKVKVVKKGKEIEVPADSNLMKALLANQVPVASSCHGDGVCGKCKVIVLHGESNLSLVNETEKLLIEKFNLKKNERISCQVSVLGDVEVDTGYW
jgi:2Fe-2S ferredoxin